jgi:hypothetical protein
MKNTVLFLTRQNSWHYSGVKNEYLVEKNHASIVKYEGSVVSDLPVE